LRRFSDTNKIAAEKKIKKRLVALLFFLHYLENSEKGCVKKVFFSVIMFKVGFCDGNRSPFLETAKVSTWAPESPFAPQLSLLLRCLSRHIERLHEVSHFSFYFYTQIIFVFGRTHDRKQMQFKEMDQVSAYELKVRHTSLQDEMTF